jgi:uncharacterized protein
MKIVIDTNVLISAFLFGGLSSEIYDYCYIFHEIIISENIISELKDVCKIKFDIPDIKIKNILKKLKEGCTIINPKGVEPDICRDKDDNKIIHLGLFTKSDYIITGDKDLLDLKEIEGIKILNPRDYWKKKSNFS